MATASTGLAAHDQPIAVAVHLMEVEFPAGHLCADLADFYGEREPTVSIMRQAHDVHGIDHERVNGKAIDQFKLWALVNQASMIIAHNAVFHRRMLSKLIPGVEHLTWCCSNDALHLDWRWCEGGRSLRNLCDWAGVPTANLGTPMADVTALRALLLTRISDRGRAHMGQAVRRPWCKPWIA